MDSVCIVLDKSSNGVYDYSLLILLVMDFIIERCKDVYMYQPSHLLCVLLGMYFIPASLFEFCTAI